MSADSGQSTVQQMFATLLGEITSLRKQNEEQQRQLEHLRGDMSLLLERSNNYPLPRRMTHFNRLPLEIREMIWELAVPSRLLGFGVKQRAAVPSALSVPTVAHVCRESRRVVMARKTLALSGRSNHFDGPSQLWRLKYEKLAFWTWFTPRKDALLINSSIFKPYQQYERNQLIFQAAQHIVLEKCSVWDLWPFTPRPDNETKKMLKRFSTWVQAEVLESGRARSTHDPVYNLRTVDFAMSTVTKIDRNYPPNFVRRLFAEDHVKIVDLTDERTVRAIDGMLKDELSQVMDTNSEIFGRPTDLETSFYKYKATAGSLFPRVRASLLSALAGCYHRASKRRGDRSLAALPSPFRDGKLDMEVTWVKELTKLVNIRPVHVFVRAEGISDVYW